jgi:diguanylate cyclase (GGDEF)-like protein
LCNAVIALGLLLLSSFIFSREAQHSQEKLTLMATTDPLTGLMNRRSVLDYVEAAHEENKENNSGYFIAIGDIDDFKKINDVYGHDCGDEVLKQVATTISRYTGDIHKCSRWGGEEFLLLLYGNDRERVFTLIESIRNEIAGRKVIYEDKEVAVTVTFGIAKVQSGMASQEVIVEADKNLYLGKGSGKNKVIG